MTICNQNIERKFKMFFRENYEVEIDQNQCTTFTITDVSPTNTIDATRKRQRTKVASTSL